MSMAFVLLYLILLLTAWKHWLPCKYTLVITDIITVYYTIMLPRSLKEAFIEHKAAYIEKLQTYDVTEDELKTSLKIAAFLLQTLIILVSIIIAYLCYKTVDWRFELHTVAYILLLGFGIIEIHDRIKAI